MGNISIQGVGKAYKQYPSKVHRVLEWFFPFLGQRHSLKWILRNINIEIHSGETVGVIGVNGAGKSTLLKMVTGTSRPTEGAIKMNGSVAALLELGMGFHPDFTGRENAYMSGQLLGLSKQTMDELISEIEEFSEIGEYIDSPVRVYSSGMQVRLAFAVATAVRPDILIVDEALSVGDVYFQHKCLERIKRYCSEGTTLLFVSHDKGAIQNTCDRAIMLEGGGVVKDGDPEMVMDYYNATLSKSSKSTIVQTHLESGRLKTTSGTGEAEITSIKFLNASGEESTTFHTGENVRLILDVLINQDVPKLVLGYSLKDRMGQMIYGTNTALKDMVIESPKAGDTVKYTIDFCLELGLGNFSIQTALGCSDNHIDGNYQWVDLAYTFEVLPSKTNDFSGVARMNPTILIEN